MLLSAIKLFRQELDRMHRVDAGQAVHLAAAGEAGGDQPGGGIGGQRREAARGWPARR